MDGAKSYREITCEYYSKWLGQDEILSRGKKGIEYVYSAERNTAQFGYDRPFDMYVLCRKEQIVISYGDRIGDRIAVLKGAIRDGMAAEEIGRVLEEIFGRKASRSVKYVFEKELSVAPEAKVLTMEDYGKYEEFWLKCYPSDGDTGWLREYFEEMASERLCVGAFADGALVSCTDAPGMPYMKDYVREIGVNTLQDHRRRGYAAAACSKCVDEILKSHKVPLWSTSVNNAASRKLAERIGFAEFAEVVQLTI